MSKGAFPVGFSMVAAGGYLIDCAVKDRAPIGTIEDLIRDPSNFESVLHGEPPAYPSGGVDTGPPNTGHTSTNPGIISYVVGYWAQQIGKPYKWGATGPDAFDCSGLMYAGYLHAGIHIPRTTYGMLMSPKLEKVYSLSACLPGDIIFPYPGHCFGYIGGNQMIEAPHTGEVIHQAAVYKFWTARRVVHAT